VLILRADARSEAELAATLTAGLTDDKYAESLAEAALQPEFHDMVHRAAAKDSGETTFS
jgi:hypothetical protein